MPRGSTGTSAGNSSGPTSVTQGTIPWVISGSIDVISVIPLTGATNLGKAIDNASGATDTGVAGLAVRDDTLTTLTPVDGDYVVLREDQWGDLWASLGTKLDSTNDSITAVTSLPAAATIAADTVTPTVPGIASYNFIKTPGANTWDRAYSAVNATNSTGTGITAVGLLAQFDDVSPTAITENQFGNIRMSTNRNLYGTIRDAAGNERGLNVSAGGNISIDTVTTLTGTTTLTPGTGAANLGKAEDAVHVSGDTGVFVLGVANVAQTTLAADGDYMALATDIKGNQLITGNIASLATDAGNPVKIGGVYNTSRPAPTNGQRVDAQIDNNGYLLARLGDATSMVQSFTPSVDGQALSTGMMVNNQPYLFNGSTEDRWRGTIAGGAYVQIKGGIAPDGASLNTYSVHLSANGTTTPTSSTAYISTITISSEVGGTTSTLTIQDKQGTPLKLINGFTTTAVTTTPTVINFQSPIKMTSGIDIITGGVSAATLDIWIDYFQ